MEFKVLSTVQGHLRTRERETERERQRETETERDREGGENIGV